MCAAVSYMDFHGGLQRGAARGYGSNGKIRSILFQTSLKHGVDMPDLPGLSRTCGEGNSQTLGTSRRRVCDMNICF